MTGAVPLAACPPCLFVPDSVSPVFTAIREETGFKEAALKGDPVDVACLSPWHS